MQQGLHRQSQQPPGPTAQVIQQANFQVRPQQFNQQYQESPLPQVSPLIAQQSPFNPQVPPPYYPQYPAPHSNNPSTSSKATLVEILQKQNDRQDRLE